MKAREKKNYVDKEQFLKALMSYAAQCREAEEAGDDKPPVPRYIGECMWSIAKGLAMRGNFSSYPFRDDMIMDGVENCLLYMHNFDPEKTSNPFGYFTKIIWYAFLRRIAKEKKQMYIRYKSSSELLMMGQTYEGEDFSGIAGAPNLEYINEFVSDYEAKIKKASKKDID